VDNGEIDMECDGASNNMICFGISYNNRKDIGLAMSLEDFETLMDIVEYGAEVYRYKSWRRIRDEMRKAQEHVTKFKRKVVAEDETNS
jgi:hypothetical protein